MTMHDDNETAYQAIIRFANQDLAGRIEAARRSKKVGCRLVLLHVMREFCEDQRRNSCVFRVYTMGKLLNRSSAAIMNALGRLEEDGHIMIECRRAPDGHDLPSRYWVTGMTTTMPVPASAARLLLRRRPARPAGLDCAGSCDDRPHHQR